MALRFDYTFPLAGYLSMNAVPSPSHSWADWKDNPAVSEERTREFSQLVHSTFLLGATPILKMVVRYQECRRIGPNGTRRYDYQASLCTILEEICQRLHLRCAFIPLLLLYFQPLMDVYVYSRLPLFVVMTFVLPWSQFKREMTRSKGPNRPVANKIAQSTGRRSLDSPLADSTLMVNKCSVSEMEILVMYLNAHPIPRRSLLPHRS